MWRFSEYLPPPHAFEFLNPLSPNQKKYCLLSENMVSDSLRLFIQTVIVEEIMI